MSRFSVTSNKRRNNMFWLFVLSLAILSIGILLMPIGSIYREKTVWLMYLSGATFWIGIIGTICMTIRINYCRKRSYYFKEKFENQKQFGLIHFFKNPQAMIADITMFVSIIGFLIVKIFVSNLVILFVFLAIFVFAFGMHCILNDINYRYLKYKIRRDEEL